MNRRKAKKRIKNKWRIKQWPGNDDPRDVDTLYTMYAAYVKQKIAEALDHAILYGSCDGGLHVAPSGIFGRST